MMSDEAALLNAIISHADEDTPRLAYADWLDENEAPLQADFIRTQCRLAACSAADPDYPDLLERHAELVAQFGPIAKMIVPKLPPGFGFDTNLDHNQESFRRGFLYTVNGPWDESFRMNPSDEEFDQFCAGLPQLIATTTARRLSLSDMDGDRLARVLAAPGAGALTGLGIMPEDSTPVGGDDALRVLARSSAVANLEVLHLWMRATAAGLRALAGAKFQRLTHLDLPMIESGYVSDLAVLTGAKWFQELRSVRAGSGSEALERALVAALAKLPRLETLDFRCSFAGARRALTARRGFPALASLAVWFTPNVAEANRLARARFPRLAELTIHRMSNAAAMVLLGAPWFPQLRNLSFYTGMLTDKFAVALSKSEVAANLRILQLGHNPLGPTGLAVLGDGARFPNLTTLDLESATRTPKAVDLVKFAKALDLPRLRHLNLSGWRLCDTGAKALAANPALAHLTRLGLRNCGISERGLTALVRSPHLQQLIELDVQHNKLKTAAALLDTDLLPRLAALQLNGNAISDPAHRKLHAARGLVV